MHQFGPVVDVDQVKAPYNNRRRLITAADVKGSAQRAHGAVTPGGSAVKDAAGLYIREPVWRYLFTHPVDQVGEPVPPDPAIPKDLRTKAVQPTEKAK